MKRAQPTSEPTAVFVALMLAAACGSNPPPPDTLISTSLCVQVGATVTLGHFDVPRSSVTLASSRPRDVSTAQGGDPFLELTTRSGSYSAVKLSTLPAGSPFIVTAQALDGDTIEANVGVGSESGLSSGEWCFDQVDLTAKK